MIFLSHTHADKPVVEPIALRLREIFGEENVFYDSWSVQPGDGIIERMNEGLQSPKFVFFFVSEQSLKSKMVSLEWQNALFKSTNGDCRIVPVRVDGCEMPPLLLQSLYVDMFAHGGEAAIVQIVNLVQGNSTFTPQHVGFSNLSYAWQGNPSESITVTIRASHLMEPNPEFALIVQNSKADLSAMLDGGKPTLSGFAENVRLDSGQIVNCLTISPLGGAITPQIPMTVALTAKGTEPIRLLGVMHKKSRDQFRSIPMAA